MLLTVFRRFVCRSCVFYLRWRRRVRLALTPRPLLRPRFPDHTGPSATLHVVSAFVFVRLKLIGAVAVTPMLVRRTTLTVLRTRLQLCAPAPVAFVIVRTPNAMPGLSL